MNCRAGVAHADTGWGTVRVGARLPATAPGQDPARLTVFDFEFKFNDDEVDAFKAQVKSTLTVYFRSGLR